MIREYMAESNFYTVLRMEGKSVDNPDQRLSVDIDQFTTNLADVTLGVFYNGVEAVFSSIELIRTRFQWHMYVVVFCWPIVNVLVLRAMLPPIVKYVYKQN